MPMLSRLTMSLDRRRPRVSALAGPLSAEERPAKELFGAAPAGHDGRKPLWLLRQGLHSWRRRDPDGRTRLAGDAAFTQPALGPSVT